MASKVLESVTCLWWNQRDLYVGAQSGPVRALPRAVCMKLVECGMLRFDHECPGV